MRRLARTELGSLFEALQRRGFELIGPTVRDGAIVHDGIDGVEDLPVGWSDEQSPGRYRLVRRDDERAFGYVVGPESWKRRLLAPRETLWQAVRHDDGRVEFEAVEPEGSPEAFVGVRACDLAAVRVQDRTLLEGRAESRYAKRRRNAFVVAVNCTEPGGLCFCASAGTGPRVGEGADVTLTERDDDFLVEAGSERGRELLSELPLTGTDAQVGGPGEDEEDDDARWLEAAIEDCSRRMGREMDFTSLPELLLGHLDHPRWDDVAERCLACGNCTNACPTCFCTTTEDHSDPSGRHASRERLWDSCFTQEHGRMASANPRPTTRDRYRQWLTHKLGTWVAQFGTSGCVGCGRCIAWCPVGIDITEEIDALRAGGEVSEPPATLGASQVVEPEVVEDAVPRVAEVVAVTPEARGVVTLHVAVEGGEALSPGQFNMLSVPGVGEAAISSSGWDGTALEHTVHAVGPTTSALCELRSGAQLGLRGPYGTAWPLEEAAGRPLVIVSGGLGLAPLRGAVRHAISHPEKYPDVRLFHGSRTPEDVLFVREMLGWTEAPNLDLHVSVDRAGPSWRGHVGVVTRLLEPHRLPAGATVLLCGPEIMMRFALERLLSAGVPSQSVYLSMERNMRCAAGHCGRCQYGPWFVCKDGPVLRHDRVAFLFGREGF